MISRRLFLGLGGLALADVLRLRAAASDLPRTRDKAVIFVYLNGGPSHIDLYDPKPDAANRSLDDPKGGRAGMDAFNSQALEMMTTNAARDAFDLSKEPEKVREKYGKGTEYILARRLVEAGVPVVSITPQNHNVPKDC